MVLLLWDKDVQSDCMETRIPVTAWAVSQRRDVVVDDTRSAGINAKVETRGFDNAEEGRTHLGRKALGVLYRRELEIGELVF